MSTKTIKQRIALVAVSALTVGLLSVVSAPASRAADNVAPGTASPTGEASVLNIATTTNTSGTAVLGNADAARSSVGLLATGDLAGTRKAQTTQTATLLSNGTLVVYTSHNASLGHMITVTGGTIVDSANSQGINSSLTAVAAGYTTPSSNDLVAAIKPTAGATAMTVTLHTAAALPSAMLAGTATLTLAGQIFVTVATASAAGTLSAARSGIWYDADGTASATQTSDEAVSGIGTYNHDTAGYAVIRAVDAYGNGLAAGLLTATATNGGLVSFGAGISSPTASTTFSTSAPDGLMMTVADPASSPLTTVVTVAHNGVVIGTKTFTFRGNVAKITLSAPKNGLTGNSASGHNTATAVFTDSAGNLLPIDNTATPASGFGTSASSAYTLALSTAPTSALGGQGTITFTCGALSSSGNAIATYTNTNGTVITSNSLAVTCSKIAYRYTASYDKASYTPGEIATLTVTFTDVDGRSAADSLTTAGDNATNVAAVISESGATKVGAAHAADDVRTSNGKIEYKYIVGQNEGTFTNSISFPQVNTNGAAQGVGATTATLTVKNATATVTNADVLKSIVSLIASINKQIQALQKLILRR